MENQHYPKFNVAAQWTSEPGIFCVQVVEIAENQVQQLLGGTHAIRVCILDGSTDASLAFVLSEHLADELCTLIHKAMDSVRTQQN